MASAKSKKVDFKFNKKSITVAANSYKSFYIISDKYSLNDNVTFKSSNKKVAQAKNEAVPYSAGWSYSSIGSIDKAIIRGYKPGKATITAYKKGTKKKLGTLNVTVKNKKASIKKKYKTVKLKYNPIYQEYVYTALLVNNPKKGAEYTAKINNKKIAKVKKPRYYKDKVNSALTIHETITSKKTGNTKVTIYEKFKGKNKTKVGTFNLKCVYINYVKALKINQSDNGDPLYFDQYVKVGDKYNIVKDVTGYYIYGLKKSEYKVTFKNLNPSVLSIDKNGLVTVLRNPDEDEEYGIEITISFKDGSKFKHKTYGPGIESEE